MYEYGYDWSEDRGYGLVQWTPRSKYWDWAVGQGLSPRVGNSQLARIDYEVENNIQYIANGHQKRYGAGNKFDFSFADFRANTHAHSVEELVEAFMWNYEGPNYEAGLNSLGERIRFAVRVRSECDFEGTSPGPGPSPDPDRPEILHYTRRHSTNMRRMGVRGRR